jgi:hypothetical protein
MKIRPDCTSYSTVWDDISQREIFTENSSFVRLLGAPVKYITIETKLVSVEDVGLVLCKTMRNGRTSFVDFSRFNRDNVTKYVLEAVIKQ